jgi:serine phosphatase RsbU (regulator of sigma subunit)
MILTDWIMRIGNDLKTLAGIFTGAVAISLFVNPFAILPALLYTQVGTDAFLSFVLGVFLVNLLAHHLSRTNERSEQRSRELAHLEALGEAIIQAPTDASTLQAMLAEHASAMFPQDIIQIRLFGPGDEAPAGLVWPQFQVLHPPNRPPLDESVWQKLQQTDNTHYVQPDVILPGMRAVYGDAVVVKVNTVNPKQEDTTTCLGGVYLLRRKTDGKTINSLAALQSLASQIASALYRAQVHAATLAHQKMAQELELAGRIQASFLPSSIPQPAGWQISAALQPARQTSGDFYDFIPLQDGRLGILVADVADKGTGAALYMALSRTLIRTYAMQYAAQPELALAAANQRILSDTQTDQFVTVFYGVLELATGALTYSNAGHNPAYLLQARDKTAQALAQTGIPLGMFEDVVWKQQTIHLNQGDTLLLYSDGVTEAQNTAGDLFDDQRLISVGSDHLGQPAADIQRAIIDSIHEFVGDAPQFDDITLLIAARE